MSILNFRPLKLRLERRIRECLQLAETYFNRSFSEPTINFQLKGVKAGVAYLERNEIRFNPTMLTENPDEFIKQVVPHELAHLLCYQLFGQVRPHGKEWSTIMTEVFHLSAEIYHQFSTANSRKTFIYHCQCQTHELSTVRHNKIQRGKVQYLCRFCHSPLKPNS